MFKIDRDTLYSKRELVQGLSGTCDGNRIMDRIRPKAVVMGVYLGSDLLDALKKAPDYRELSQAKLESKEAKAKTKAAERSAKVVSRESVPHIKSNEIRP